MANGRILDIILKTIDEVQQKNANNPREQTADPNVFDLIKSKLGEIDNNIQQKQAQKGKNPVSILDLIKNQIEAARQYNQQDPNTPTADSKIFDRIIKKVEEKPKRVASSGIRRIAEQYNLDITRVPQQTLRQIQDQYDAEQRALDRKYAEGIHRMLYQQQ